jgi:alpha-galactosidase
LAANGAEAIAVRLLQPVATLPLQIDWRQAPPISFAHDWRGESADIERQTEVKLLWNDEALFIAFRCRFRTINVFADADPNGRRDELWERDVAEVFLQPDRFAEKYYKEFEISPGGQWLDLDITPQGLRHITSGMRSRVRIEEGRRIWTAELAIPFSAVTSNFDSTACWRVNFFRCEGLEPGRYYSAWQPTGTEKPNFHLPEKFGWLRFET